MNKPIAMPEGFEDTEASAPVLSDLVRAQLAEWGRAGGYAAKRSMTKKAMREKCRNAALARWGNRRMKGGAR